MERTLVKFFAESRQSKGLVEMQLNVAAQSLHQVGLAITDHRLRTAAQAGAITGLFGLFCPQKEFDILATRAACGTRGAAIDPGTGYREHELPVVSPVASHDGVPA